jgi:hypothetical protein
MPSERYAQDIIVTVSELEALQDHIQESYSKVRRTGDGYSRLPEWRLVQKLIKRAEMKAIKATFSGDHLTTERTDK